MTNEQLQPIEQPRQQETITEPQSMASLNENSVAKLFTARQQNLATLKQWVGLKFYYRAAEKIKQEEASLRKLLRLENAKQNILSDYSFVLDQAYFEQKFLN